MSVAEKSRYIVELETILERLRKIDCKPIELNRAELRNIIRIATNLPGHPMVRFDQDAKVELYFHYALKTLGMAPEVIIGVIGNYISISTDGLEDTIEGLRVVIQDME